ncbi:IQ calmodulin binding motif-containing protein [Phytophthora infestans]|uniref:IQ calmodulin binding motif-containing protein n=1 Tax=Phytophthora infestans TaxID=4787 RepID=A0A833RRQ5_PHYIN|nr:IQ calmodulin binding motif-containing protein [Phytophthora infestans]
MAKRDEARAASFSGSLSSASSNLKLPLLLTARPGNVGVQIDSHRAIDVLSHPRSVKFTSQFHEIMYENGSLENYPRVVERTAQRARLLEDKLEKLRAREHYLLEDEAKRKQRRMQRDAARQRRIWLMLQAAKRVDERARETAAAITVQRVIRGALARRVARVLRQVRETHEAASMLQRAMQGYVARQQLALKRERRAREEEECREREMYSAATVLQRQARKRLKVAQEARQQAALAACVEDDEDEDGSESESEEDKEDTRTDERASQNDLTVDEKIIDDALRRGISLDLLFSDEEESASPFPTNSTSSSSILPIESASNTQRVVPQPPPPKLTVAQRPRRQMSVKRVGGGYRTKLLPYNTEMPPSKETPVSSTEFSATRPYSRQPHLQETVAASSDAQSASEELVRHSRRSPAIPKSPTLVAQRPNHSPRPIMESNNNEIRSVSPV